MTLSSDDRKARAEEMHRDRRARREATNARHPWLVPVVVVISVVILVVAIIMVSNLGVSFF